LASDASRNAGFWHVSSYISIEIAGGPLLAAPVRAKEMQTENPDHHGARLKFSDRKGRTYAASGQSS
jgi:hypothetical protein